MAVTFAHEGTRSRTQAIRRCWVTGKMMVAEWRCRSDEPARAQLVLHVPQALVSWATTYQPVPADALPP